MIYNSFAITPDKNLILWVSRANNWIHVAFPKKQVFGVRGVRSLRKGLVGETAMLGSTEHIENQQKKSKITVR